MSGAAPRRILPAIVLAQFLGTSPWFAANAVMPALQRDFGWPAEAVGGLTSAVQAGFIVGTLVFALLALSDRLPARLVFLACALASACCLAAPLMLGAPDALFYAWLLIWGITVAGDSPQFSALTAANAPRAAVGSVLTLSNSIGFAISIASIQLFVALLPRVELGWLLTGLALGPLLGLLALRPLIGLPSALRAPG